MKHRSANEFVSTARHSVENVGSIDVRDLVDASVKKGKAAWHTAQDLAASGAKATDRTIRNHPYPSVGIAFGVGLLLGFLSCRRE